MAEPTSKLQGYQEASVAFTCFACSKLINIAGYLDSRRVDALDKEDVICPHCFARQTVKVRTAFTPTVGWSNMRELAAHAQNNANRSSDDVRHTSDNPTFYTAHNGPHTFIFLEPTFGNAFFGIMLVSALVMSLLSAVTLILSAVTGAIINGVLPYIFMLAVLLMSCGAYAAESTYRETQIQPKYVLPYVTIVSYIAAAVATGLAYQAWSCYIYYINTGTISTYFSYLKY